MRKFIDCIKLLTVTFISIANISKVMSADDLSVTEVVNYSNKTFSDYVTAAVFSRLKQIEYSEATRCQLQAAVRLFDSLDYELFTAQQLEAGVQLVCININEFTNSQLETAMALQGIYKNFTTQQFEVSRLFSIAYEHNNFNDLKLNALKILWG